MVRREADHNPSATNQGDNQTTMWISKLSDVIGSSPTSYEDAARVVLARANRTLRGTTGLEVVEKRLKIRDGAIAEYRVRLKLSFDVAPEIDSHW